MKKASLTHGVRPEIRENYLAIPFALITVATPARVTGIPAGLVRSPCDSEVHFTQLYGQVLTIWKVRKPSVLLSVPPGRRILVLFTVFNLLV
jgi:hypothetical protein